MRYLHSPTGLLVAALLTVWLGALPAQLPMGEPATPSQADRLPQVKGFSHHWTDLPTGVTIHYLDGGGDGPLLFLLHGWPETWLTWREIMPPLRAAGYRVIAADLRGLGDSSRPSGGYDRLSMAEDMHQLLRQLGGARTYLVGHDWGGSTAAAWAGAYPDEIEALVVVEALPNGPWSGPKPWFYQLHREPGLAETLTAGRERAYLSYFYRVFSADSTTIGQEEIDAYLRTYGSPAGMYAGFAFVRALPADLVANERAARTPSPVPVLAIGAAASMGEEVADNLRPLFTSVRSEVIPGTGHFILEEAPDVLLERLLAYLSEEHATSGSNPSRPLLPTGVREVDLTVSGVRLHYYAAGAESREPIVLLRMAGHCLRLARCDVTAGCPGLPRYRAGPTGVRGFGAPARRDSPQGCGSSSTTYYGP